jgi:hypothetical protein
MFLMRSYVGLLQNVNRKGVAAYEVSTRTRGIGIRIALGATPLQVVTLVLKRTLILAGPGILFGFAPVFPGARGTNISHCAASRLWDRAVPNSQWMIGKEMAIGVCKLLGTSKVGY